MKKTATTTLIKAALFCFLGLISTSTRAADKADPTGTWKWSNTFNGNTRESTLTLKLDGEKLTGKMSGRNGNDTDIENAKVKGDEITFDVTRERNGNKFTSKYNGKLSGDTITGKIESKNRDGEATSRDWTAKRDGGKPAADNSAKNLTGDWKYTVNTPNGQTLEPTLKLKQDGDKLTGTLVMNTRETPITDAKIDGNKVTFTVERERNGNKVTSKYDAKLEGGDLKGKITSNFGGNDRTYDFDAKKQ
ncbi:MAG: hypothetical protein JWM99_1200 [Verrucomicrobiales bacterium]|nr:hypothetical protein [Verrucomicrobiales bacterium]